MDGSTPRQERPEIPAERRGDQAEKGEMVSCMERYLAGNCRIASTICRVSSMLCFGGWHWLFAPHTDASIEDFCGKKQEWSGEESKEQSSHHWRILGVAWQVSRWMGFKEGSRRLGFHIVFGYEIGGCDRSLVLVDWDVLGRNFERRGGAGVRWISTYRKSCGDSQPF